MSLPGDWTAAAIASRVAAATAASAAEEARACGAGLLAIPLRGWVVAYLVRWAPRRAREEGGDRA